MVYVPERRRADFVGRLRDEVLLPGGRLIVSSYGSGQTEPVGERLRQWGFEVVGETGAVNPDGIVNLRAAWIEAPA